MNTFPLCLIGDIGGGELILVAAAILLLFGGKRLPSIARTIGKTVEELRKTSQDFKDQLLKADEPMADEPVTPPPETSLSGLPPASAAPAPELSPDPAAPKETPPRDLAG